MFVKRFNNISVNFKHIPLFNGEKKLLKTSAYFTLSSLLILTLLFTSFSSVAAVAAEKNGAFVKNYNNKPLVDTDATKNPPEESSSRYDKKNVDKHSVAAFSSSHVSSEDGGEHKLSVNIEVSNSSDGKITDIRLNIPLLSAKNSTYQFLNKEIFSHEPADISKNGTNTRSALIEIPSLSPGESEQITMEYYLETYPVNYDFSEKIADEEIFEKMTADNFSNYLQPSEKIESDDLNIKRKAEDITEGLNDDLQKAREIYKFVLAHMSYDLNSENRNKGALSALKSGTGVCEDYASLFSALSRASGIPSRMVNGYADPAGNGNIWELEEGNELSLEKYRHSWAEFYLEGLGWVPVDPTMDIYSQEGSYKYFGAISQTSHLAQNYGDINLTANYRGSSQPSISWNEKLIGIN